MKIITAGSAYLDIDAYACCVAMQELLALQGEEVIAYSAAESNYSVCQSLIQVGQVRKQLPSDVHAMDADYIIVDVSDPDFIKDFVPLDRVVAVYDHHVGFEEFWTNRIGDKSHIEFIGAAATLIYREWEKAGVKENMTPGTAKLLIAAILDNTLNLTSANTADEDRMAFKALCKHANVSELWCADYFSEVQANVEADLKNALLHDIKLVQGNPVLPSRVAQLCVWDSKRIFSRINEIRQWLDASSDPWMINLIDIKENCSYFVCNDLYYQSQIGKVFDVVFHAGIARTSKAYLRKEILKKIRTDHLN